MDWNEFLREAVDAKDIDLVRQALGEGANPNGVDEEGSTPLFWAVFGGQIEIVRALLKAGALVAADTQNDSLTLHAAAEGSHSFLVNLLLVNLLLDYDGETALNRFDYIERTPLMVAVQSQSVEIVRRLIEAGADVNAHDELRAGDTALHKAVKTQNSEIIKLLLKAGADPTIRGWMWITPLDDARKFLRGDGPHNSALLEQAAKQFGK